MKMLFSTERKALDFIKYNGGEITDNPEILRAYQCPACCGWHISSKPHRNSYDHHTDNLIKAYKKNKTVFNLTLEELTGIEEGIRELITKNGITSKSGAKKLMTEYFAGHPVKDETSIRTNIYEWLKHKKKC